MRSDPVTITAFIKALFQGSERLAALDPAGYAPLTKQSTNQRKIMIYIMIL